MRLDDEIFDDLFHGCALEAWVRTAHATGRWPPESEPVRRLAFALYEAALREGHAENPMDTSAEPCHGGTMHTD